MKIQNADTIEVKPVEIEGAEGVTMRMLIGPADGAPNFNMRQFEVAPAGCTPRHTHDWEHEVYVLAGEGAVLAEGREHQIAAGDCAFVPPNVEHQFRNTGGENLKFLCLVPRDSG